MKRMKEQCSGPWTPLKKYIDTKPTPYYIPVINDAMPNDEKAAEFTKTFFPPPPPANLSDVESTTYSEPVQLNKHENYGKATRKSHRQAISE